MAHISMAEPVYHLQGTIFSGRQHKRIKINKTKHHIMHQHKCAICYAPSYIDISFSKYKIHDQGPRSEKADTTEESMTFQTLSIVICSKEKNTHCC